MMANYSCSIYVTDPDGLSLQLISSTDDGALLREAISPTSSGDFDRFPTFDSLFSDRRRRGDCEGFSDQAQRVTVTVMSS
jgi:hypothetical protein